MPPCNTNVVQRSTLEDKSAEQPILSKSKNPIALNDLRKAIPEKAFEKSLVKSVYYMVFDYVMWFGSVILMRQFCQGSLWNTLPFWQQSIATLIFWNVTGFFMWCIFMIGHDCGHTTFSNYEIVNDFFGHITHGSLLVPFYPWQLSHRRHHMYHNHVDKDYSYPWYTNDRLQKDDEKMARFLHENPFIIFFFPFFGWPTYFLFGMPDGNHMYPFANDRLWKETPMNEFYKCFLSSAVVILNFVAVYYLFDKNISEMAYYYLAPWVLFGWWLITVTYLQHHDPNTLVYDDNDWSFVDAAFETVDRKFGYGIDSLHHHITDGHVVHHIFFTKIPHYNLPIATEALKKFLNEKNLGYLYKFENTFDFPLRVHNYFLYNGFRSVRASEVKQE